MTAVTTGLLCPFDLTVEPVARFLNAEIADHPVYDGFELQWFDDAVHGVGMLAFLSRRADRRVDYYVDPDLDLDRSTYRIGGGTGSWSITDFEDRRLDIGPDGVVAEVRFADVDGRSIEIVLDDCGSGPRRHSDLLAPVGGGIDEPASLLLVYMHGFDLLRRGVRRPRIRIDGEQVTTGSLPGAFLHRRHLIKAAAPLTVATVCRNRSGTLEPVDPTDPGGPALDASGSSIAGLVARGAGAEARLDFEPPFPQLVDLPDGGSASGAWSVAIDGAPITGGDWRAARRDQRIELTLEVERQWSPPPELPVLMRVVTRVVPLFRRWPTTYRWTAEIDLGDGAASIASRWERTTEDRGAAYRRVTSS